MRIAFVTPRYGPDIVGGAEQHIRGYAEHLQSRGHYVTVLTTCAIDHATWQNVLPPGDSLCNGVRVRRFPITQPADREVLERFGAAMAEGFTLPAPLQEEWVRNTGYSQPLLDAISVAADDRMVLYFAPYLFASTVFGAMVRPERSVVMPCLHDEPFARFEVVQSMLGAVAGLVFNTDAECRLAQRLAGWLPAHRIVGPGFSLPYEARPPQLRAIHRTGEASVIYVGRREAGKNFPLLVQWLEAYNEGLSRTGTAHLVLMGGGDYAIPRKLADHVLDLGFASPETKDDEVAASTVLANLSRNESFSQVVAEAWLVRTPVIVHADCEVTREHCQRSGGGLWVRSPEAFATALDRIRSDPALRSAMGEAGRAYVEERYGWPPVLDRLERALHDLAPWAA